MQKKPDAELLRDYAVRGSEAAFGEIVRRYANFVYSAALRQTCEPELARDVAQVVFVDLARKAGTLRPNIVLIGWLCRAARLAALEQLRQQHRRLQRERQAMTIASSSTELSDDWSKVRPVLDEALGHLGDEDRNALLLRFFKNESLASVGVTLGVSEDAAQKRVARALDKLREFLSKRGVNATAAGLSVVLTANGVQAAPAGFDAALTAGALAKAAAAGTSLSFTNFLTAHSMKTTILSLILAAGVAGLTVQQVKTSRQLREAQNTIEQQNESLQQLHGVKDQLAAKTDELQTLRDNSAEVARLRGEIAALRRERAEKKVPAVAQTAQPAGATHTNAALPSISLTAKMFMLPSEDLKAMPVGWSGLPDGGTSAVLSKEQFQTLTQALDGANDVKPLGAPRVITLPGVEAKLFVGPNGTASVAGGGGAGGGFGGPSTTNRGGGIGGSGGAGWLPNGANLRVLPAGTGAAAGEPPANFSSNMTEGLSVSVLPNPMEDGSGFDLQPTAGFASSATQSTQADGKELPSTQAKVHLAVLPGQTVALAKEVPSVGWADADNTIPGPRTILVFLTPATVHFTTRLASTVHWVERGGVTTAPSDRRGQTGK